MTELEKAAVEAFKQLGNTSFLEIFKAGANWRYEQFEKNRLAACDNMTKEEAKREQEFVTYFLEKNLYAPTYSDAIEYGRKQMIDRADKLEKLGQAMYDKMQNLTTDCTGIRAAMDKWWCYINYKED